MASNTKPTQMKNRIIDELERLQREGVFGTVLKRGMNESIFDLDVAKWPLVVVPPILSVQSDYLTNVENVRVYSFSIYIVVKNEDYSKDFSIEDLTETVMNAFDNLPSLDGLADGGMEPSIQETASISSRGKDYTILPVILKAKASLAIDLSGV